MPKITLSNIGGAMASVTAVNDRLAKIEAYINNESLSRSNPTLSPNEMQVQLDMNGFEIINDGNGFVTEDDVIDLIADLVGRIYPTTTAPITATAGQTTFAFSGDPVVDDDASSVRVTVDGQVQIPDVDYTVSGNNVVFAEGLLEDEVVLIILYPPNVA